MRKLIGISETSGRPVFLENDTVTTGCFEGSVKCFLRKAAKEKKSWVLELDGFSKYGHIYKEYCQEDERYLYYKLMNIASRFGVEVRDLGDYFFELKGHELLPFNQFIFYFKKEIRDFEVIETEDFLSNFKATIAL